MSQVGEHGADCVYVYFVVGDCFVESEDSEPELIVKSILLLLLLERLWCLLVEAPGDSEDSLSRSLSEDKTIGAIIGDTDW
jgi:hypothetical protein